MNVKEIRPDLPVQAKGDGATNGSQSVYIGTVDHLEGTDWIKLKREDSTDGRDHWIPVDWVERFDDKVVRLWKTADQVKRGLLNENPAIPR